MDPVIRKLQRLSEVIAARHRLPEFYVRFLAPAALARQFFHNNPLVLLLREEAAPRLADALGHGLFHSTRVALDAAAITCVELEQDGADPRHTHHQMVLALMAGFIHDICRGQKHHAQAGAREVFKVLKWFPMDAEDIQAISCAIGNHEAFIAPLPCRNASVQLLSDALYDADKFRWGPDTFTHTFWHMASHQGLTPRDIIARFPWGMSGVARIADTFRTPAGRQYGPEIIETGIAIGREIYQALLRRFPEEAR